MGFKSKEVSMGAHKSSQGAHSRQPPLNCPRCNSSNTKFCYYNNHNESQPRYYCKSCKRHWTQGGTLRDVPVGGTRRNKRLKTSTSGSSSGTGDCVQQQQYQLTLDTNTFMLDSTPLLPSFFFNNLTPFDSLNSTFSFTNLNQFQLPNSDEIVQEENPSNTITNKATTEAIKSSWELPSTSSLIPFDASISPFFFTSPVQFQPSNSDEITQEEHPCNSSSTTTNNTASEVINPSLELPSTSTVMDSLRDWSWDDLNMLISTTTTATDINQPLDGLQIEEHEV